MAMYRCTKFQLIWKFQILEPNLPKKIWVTNVPLYQILVRLENFSFWDRICPKKTLGWGIKTNSTWVQVVSGSFWVVPGCFRSFLVLVSTVSFLIKLQTSVNFAKFLTTPFLQNTSNGCFYNSWHFQYINRNFIYMVRKPPINLSRLTKQKSKIN